MNICIGGELNGLVLEKKPSTGYYQQLIKTDGKTYRFWFSKSESFKDSYNKAMKLVKAGLK
ncbi:hypothetical protein [Acinetobacter guillouiae]|uniref:hypothetical protein n=1 Tax=Acinetobacter guillouiae TaxID=106649 RepID=UPI002FD9E8AA